ncbi:MULTISPECIES: ABC transporter ATP-binding protein [Holdemanella]|jgi:ATP-binding cassette subfamily B protein|uniref:ATP-binding cassette domain-containing protein n=1 Tax=Holdemanella TaxID=1573535 RepID=UPI002584E2B7|nr:MULTISPECIES: ABC transporter ATP-binding protein [Holdemanella]
MKDFIKYSFSILKRDYACLIYLTTLCTLTSILNLFLPLIAGNFINKLISNPRMGIITQYCLVILILNLISYFLAYMIMRLNISIQINSTFNLNKNILQKIQRVSLLYLQNKDIAYMNQRINNDVNTMVIFVINVIKDVLVNMISLLFSISFLFRISELIFFVFFIVLILYILLYKTLKRRLLLLKKLVLERQSEYFSKLQEMLTYVKFTKIYNYTDFLIKPLTKKNDELKKTLLENQKYTYILTVSEQIIVMIFQICLYIIGGVQVINGKLSVGMFTIMSTYLGNVITSFKYFSTLYQQYLSAYVSYQRIIEFENLKDDNCGNMNIEDVEEIFLDNFSYTYNTQNKIIDNINYKFKVNEIYFISGKNGSGKTTLVNSILGLYSEYDGNILVDGYSIKNINMYSFREKFVSFIDQHGLLINSSIYENISLNQNISIKTIETYLLDFGLIKAYDEANEYLSKNINELSSNLSGGECQKICLIREFLRNKKVMIFDEPTSYLDVYSKNVFIKYVRNLKENHIVIIISHDEELFQKIDGKYLNL